MAKSEFVLVRWRTMALAGLCVSLSCAPGCGSGTSTGNPAVSLSFASYDNGASSTLEQRDQADGLRPLAVSQLAMCFKRLRFKRAGESTNPNPAADEDNLDFSIGSVTLSPSGTRLRSVRVPAGVYRRVEFDLEDSCASGRSLILTNAFNQFSTTERITIKFEGEFTVKDGQNANLSLKVQSLVDALDTVQFASDIRSKAEAVTGSF